ncbi:MAG TPA: DUF5710 domain-containing protein [Pseudonocardia sp.]|nr:DUF5710 domain-containing protein [Pseudonocardia sp.]
MRAPPDRHWLDVPFRDKDAAKARGARWDSAAKRWYDPDPPTSGLQQWAALPAVPDVLPGEDRTFGSGLFVDLVPASCWFTNVRTCVLDRDWERLRRMITRRAGQRCEICERTEDRESRRWLEAHERWFYDATDPTARVQTLRRLICLCSDCHRATHFGFAEVTGHAAEAFVHLTEVTGMTDAQAHEHIEQAVDRWEERSRHTWALDLRMLTGAGITVQPPPDASVRQRIADRET